MSNADNPPPDNGQWHEGDEQENADRDRLPRDHRDPHGGGQLIGLLVVGLLWAGTLAGLVMWGLSVGDDPAAGSPTTAQPSAQSCRGAALPRGKKPASLNAVTPASGEVAFGRTVGETRRRLEYEVQGLSRQAARPRCIRVQVGPFLPEAGAAELASKLISTKTQLVGNRAVVDVRFDRSNAPLTGAGLYAGLVSVVDPRFERVDIPMTVSMSYPVWQFPVALFVALLLPEFVYVWLVKGSFQSRHATYQELTLPGFATYLCDRNGLIALGTGTVASFGVLRLTYFASTAWDGDFLRFAGLTGAMFSAFVAAATAVAAAGADKPAPGTARA